MISNQWLWITVPIALIGLVALPFFVWRLIEANSTDVVLSVPLLAEQEISIDTAGTYVLNAEGTAFSFAFNDLGYQLVDLSDQSVVRLEPVRVPVRTSGISKWRLTLQVFQIEKPGRFRLIASGITDPSVSEKNSLVVTHDTRGSKVGIILGTVFSAIALLGGLGLSIGIFQINR